MLSCKSSKFSLPAGSTYLNCAYMSPLLKSAEKAGIRGVRRKRNPVEIPPADFFNEAEKLRAAFAALINAKQPERIAIIPSVSYGLSSVARNVKITKDQHILVAADQFPSNYYPWESLCKETGASIKTVSPEGMVDRGKKWNEKILSSIDRNTRVVALPHTHWTDGTKFDLPGIRQRTTEVGALLIVDGTQSVGAMPFDVTEVKPDALVCAGYKWLLGPYSIGVAYFGEYFDDGRPLEENWINRMNSEDFNALVEYEPRYQPGALRYEVGEHSNFILVPMLLNSIGQLNKWHVENVQEYCRAIAEPSITALKSKGFWIEDPEYRGSHLFGIRLPKGADMRTVKEQLTKNKIYVSFRGDAIRVSPNVYNDSRDLQKLAKVLSLAVK